MLETILTLSDTTNHPFYKKIDFFSKITSPILHRFQPLHGVTTSLPTFAVPQKGWSNTSFITPESCIALVYSEPYEKSIWKNDPNRNSALPLADFPLRPNVFLAFRIPWFLFHPFFKLIFRMVPNKLAQYNFQALWTRYWTTLFGVQRKLVTTW